MQGEEHPRPASVFGASIKCATATGTQRNRHTRSFLFRETSSSSSPVCRLPISALPTRPSPTPTNMGFLDDEFNVVIVVVVGFFWVAAMCTFAAYKFFLSPKLARKQDQHLDSLERGKSSMKRRSTYFTTQKKADKESKGAKAKAAAVAEEEQRRRKTATGKKKVATAAKGKAGEKAEEKKKSKGKKTDAPVRRNTAAALEILENAKGRTAKAKPGSAAAEMTMDEQMAMELIQRKMRAKIAAKRQQDAALQSSRSAGAQPMAPAPLSLGERLAATAKRTGIQPSRGLPLSNKHNELTV